MTDTERTGLQLLCAVVCGLPTLGMVAGVLIARRYYTRGWRSFLPTFVLNWIEDLYERNA